MVDGRNSYGDAAAPTVSDEPCQRQGNHHAKEINRTEQVRPPNITGHLELKVNNHCHRVVYSCQAAVLVLPCSVVKGKTTIAVSWEARVVSALEPHHSFSSLDVVRGD